MHARTHSAWVFVALLGCGGHVDLGTPAASDASPQGGGGSGGSGGSSTGASGGRDAAFDVDAASAPDAAEHQSRQLFCEPNPPALPAGCPMVEPTDRSPCPELGVECIYPHGTQLDPNGIQLDIVDCIQMTVSDQAWIVYQDFCRRDCSPLSDAGAFVDISGTTPCAARNVVDCTALYAGSISPYDTNQSSLDSMLISDAAKCEVVPGSYGLVFFDQGCATRMWSPAASSSTASMCVANAVANERFRCATNLGCGVVGVPRLDGAVEVGRGSEL